MNDNTNGLRSDAERCRRVARSFAYPKAIEHLLEIAAELEALALRLESDKRGGEAVATLDGPP
jgi:hypothetical protein